MMPPTKATRLSFECGEFDPRRYSKRWYARVLSWDDGCSPELEFGTYYGDESGGVCELDCGPKELIRFGQRDYSGGGTYGKWAIWEDEEVRDVGPAEARLWYRENKSECGPLLTPGG